jgi:hypothetical protein
MTTTVKRPTDIEVSHVLLELPVRYDEEDIPNDFPLRVGDMWYAKVNIDTGKIEDWPQGKEGDIECMKVTDSGIYTLLAPNGTVVATRQNYVPHGLVPGDYGDFVSLKINAQGIITNWPKRPDLSAFFQDDE